MAMSRAFAAVLLSLLCCLSMSSCAAQRFENQAGPHQRDEPTTGEPAGRKGIAPGHSRRPSDRMVTEYVGHADNEEERYRLLRDRMVTEQIAARGVDHPLVLAAMRKVPRHLFVPEGWRESAYADCALPIGEGQTISQPYIVAFMTEALDPQPHHRVLDIGTGSGYQAAVLAEIVREVYTIEINPVLAEHARKLLEALGYRNIFCRVGDGNAGWPEAAPFDGVAVAAAAARVPPALIEQLAPGGRLIMPIGSQGLQHLVLVTKERDGTVRQTLALPDVRFVPLLGSERPAASPAPEEQEP
jgi:protein-L-isoaspartate(D-aspartate) O-methyltransferase